MKMFSHSLPVCARQLLKAPYTERYVRCCERTAVSHRLLLDLPKMTSTMCCVWAAIQTVKGSVWLQPLKSRKPPLRLPRY